MQARNHVAKVLTVLLQAQREGTSWLWVREIARRTKLHPEVVRRVVDGYLSNAIESAEVDPLLEKGLRIRPVMLKPGVTVEGHLRYLKAMGKL